MHSIRIQHETATAPRGFAVLEYYSVADASKAIAACPTGLTIDGYHARLCYAPAAPLETENPAIAAAVEQAQRLAQQNNEIAYQAELAQKRRKEAKEQSAAAALYSQSQSQTQHAIPDGYMKDPNSEFYCDPNTGFYFDPATGYYCYFNTEASQVNAHTHAHTHT